MRFYSTEELAMTLNATKEFIRRGTFLSISLVPPYWLPTMSPITDELKRKRRFTVLTGVVSPPPK